MQKKRYVTILVRDIMWKEASFMVRFGLVFVLLGTLSWGQTGSPNPPVPAQSSPTGAATPTTPPAEPDLPADAPVITIEGMCEQAAGSEKPPADCKTMITKAQFEAALKALQPALPPFAQRQQFARRYAMLMIFANQAHKQGLDSGPKFEEQMRLTRMEIAARALGQSMQEKANAATDTEVTEYYQAHANNYEQVDVQQIFVPHAKSSPPAKPGKAPAAKAAEVTEDATKKQVEVLYKRAVAGEDFGKLQAEAYTFAGLKTKPPDTKVTGLKRGSLTPNRAVVFDLKPGEVSKVVTDPTGYFIYKLEKKESTPLATVRPEIENAIKAQKMQAAIQSIERAATPKYEEKYFGPSPATGSPAGMVGGPAHPAPTPVAPPNNP
jgi:peptidyl-prolyl cis-trans isomerase C